ncbi:MAG TPA: hypothetical protein VGR92_10065 [Steroidobacteraceae bacterium]|nr:hypothetical protein [Steroidobacteraceae bacterium]
MSNPPSSGLWYTTTQLGSAVASSSVIWNPYLTNGTQGGQLEMMLFGPAFLGSGTYQDTVRVWVCTDSKCANPIAGSPISVDVTYIVTGNAVSDATYSILPAAIVLESPSNGTAQTTTVNVTAYDVPPYGAYVFQTSQAGGPIASMSFKQTSGNAEPYAYGTGVLTVNMRTPASLGPGIYSDAITLSICYDQGCSKQAVGSPYIIPVTYTVTASAGREFQEQIVEQNLTALAVDPTGTILYGTTAPSDLNAPTYTPAQLVEINPATGASTALLSLPAGVSQIAVSQDGKYIYLLTAPLSTLSPPVQVIRVQTSGMAIDQTVPLTSMITSPAQIAISPVSSSTWAAAFETVADVWNVEIFDDGVARPDVWSVTSDVVYGNEAIWSADGLTVYVLDANLSAVAVSSSGLGSGTQLQAGSAAQSGFDQGGGIQLAGAVLYSDSGGALNLATDAISGQYTFPSGVPYAPLTVDTANNRVFASYVATEGGTAEGTIESFNLDAFTPLWIARLPNGTQPLRWGTNGLAWLALSPTITGAEALYLINGTFVAP